MTKFGKLVLALIVVAVLSVAVFFLQKKPTVQVAEDYQETMVLREILGNRDDLVSFSVLPNSKVSGVLAYTGVVQGGYFFEGNILVNILSADVLKTGNAMATTDWMTDGPVEFEGSIDISLVPKGPGYIQIHNDNASGLPEHNKSILIPIIIE